MKRTILSGILATLGLATALAARNAAPEPEPEPEIKDSAVLETLRNYGAI